MAAGPAGVIEEALETKAAKIFLPTEVGEVPRTEADTSASLDRLSAANSDQ